MISIIRTNVIIDVTSNILVTINITSNLTLSPVIKYLKIYFVVYINHFVLYSQSCTFGIFATFKTLGNIDIIGGTFTFFTNYIFYKL